MTTTHTIFGAGQVGLLLARDLAATGASVRLVRRGPAGPSIDGVRWMQGDVTNPAFADEACRGAAVVYNCTNPPDYARWDGVLQPLYRAGWRAAARAGARLVQLDCLYAYGRPPTCPFDETTPEEPCRDKGRLRQALAEELRAMHARGEVEATIARASDYFGPDTPYSFVSRPEMLTAIRKGGTAYVFGDPELPHAYTFTPDVARALAVLGAHPAAPGRTWHVPTTFTGTTRELIDALAHAAGTRVTTRAIPRWLLRGAGLLSPMMRALGEMAYQFEIPYVLDDRAFRHTYGIEPTPLDEAIRMTLDGSTLLRASA